MQDDTHTRAILPNLLALVLLPHKQASWIRPAVGAGAGLGLANLYENDKLLGEDASPRLRYMNSALTSVVGGLAAAKPGPAGLSKLIGPAAAAALWTGKMPFMAGANELNRFTRAQEPIAQTNLETAKLNQSAAQIEAAQAGKLRPTDIAQLGMAGAGLAGLGGLGYYLYKTLGPGKKKPAPRYRVDLPGGSRPGNIEIEGELDALDLSKRLTKALSRDTRKQFRSSALENTHHRSSPDRKKVAHLIELLELC